MQHADNAAHQAMILRFADPPPIREFQRCRTQYVTAETCEQFICHRFIFRWQAYMASPANTIRNDAGRLAIAQDMFEPLRRTCRRTACTKPSATSTRALQYRRGLPNTALPKPIPATLDAKRDAATSRQRLAPNKTTAPNKTAIGHSEQLSIAAHQTAQV